MTRVLKDMKDGCAVPANIIDEAEEHMNTLHAGIQKIVDDVTKHAQDASPPAPATANHHVHGLSAESKVAGASESKRRAVDGQTAPMETSASVDAGQVLCDTGGATKKS